MADQTEFPPERIARLRKAWKNLPESKFIYSMLDYIERQAAEIERLNAELKEHEEDHWCFNPEHRTAIIERDKLHARVAELEAALGALWQLIEHGELVRNTRFDDTPDWVMRHVEFVKTLKRASDALRANFGPTSTAKQPESALTSMSQNESQDNEKKG